MRLMKGASKQASKQTAFPMLAAMKELLRRGGGYGRKCEGMLH